ncbi:hypothetical protein [Afifella marina]|uniref:Uncharacterized protein n=1 Tax=Afifella marina DSM 2698 TaxID=1120955 RepID=A0A1G5P4T2_AFIMA|nr:hypothetical protein [Afifella marina]MBK1625012.1 hypothetical protein [Afifella marina DSM 2698]MBK1628716.1 hypothetical protein [Afifella marina]MBK5918374.1 hypothetical protein [Afifella marina]RAI19563.1 hypothetical protein CH311_12190 [Afifella marina DSM 2698]SCZ44563.1 hypothetical protein SAMN03080610_03235 [Afifella marina DSM 2698]
MLLRILAATALTLAAVAGYAHASFQHPPLPTMISIDAWVKSDEAPACRASIRPDSTAACRQESPAPEAASHR